MVHGGRLELPCPRGHQFLRLACLPIPPAVCFSGTPSKCGSMGRRRKETADMQLSRLLRKPRKRNAAGFFRRGTQSESRTRKPVMGVGPSDRCVYHFTICAYWRSESGSRREASPCGKRSRAFLPRLLSGEVSYLLEYHSVLAATAGFEPAHGSSPSTGFPNRPLQPLGYVTVWRFQSDSNRRSRICRPLPYQLGYGTECMAAAVGLEPTHGFPPHGFQDRSLTI